LFFPPYTLKTQSVVVGGKACDEGAWGRGQGKPGRGKGKGKGKGKGSGAGVGSTYANPGRPKSPRSKIDSERAVLPSISGERRIRQGQRLVPLRVPKCEADSKPAGRGYHRPLT
jgi:hypothetical protein